MMPGYRSNVAAAVTLLLSAALAAQTVTPPPQADTGPGGRDYAYDSMTAVLLGSDMSSGSDVYWLFTPAAPVPDSAIVIACLHGSMSGPVDIPNWGLPGEYLWIRHMVRKGYVVVYPFPSGVDGIWSTLQDAFVQVEADGIALYRNGSGDVRYGATGNSLGGYNSFQLAAGLAGNVPPEAIMPVHSPDWTDVSTIPVETNIVQLCGFADNNSATNLPNQESIWAKLDFIPCTNKAFLMVMNHRVPPAPVIWSDHMFPSTGADTTDSEQVNALDYHGTWKFSVALFNCTFFGTDCAYCLGGGPDVTYMGTWSEGTPYAPARVLDSCAVMPVVDPACCRAAVAENRGGAVTVDAMGRRLMQNLPNGVTPEHGPATRGYTAVP